MSYLFYVDEKNRAVLHPEVVKLMPSFRSLSDNEVLYIVLYADYNSPYKQYPEHERKRKAMWHAFDENESELIESDRIKIAVEDYVSLQYNRKVETIRNYEQKIDSLLVQLQEDDSPSSIKKIDDAIDALRKRITAMQNEVTAQVQSEGVIKGKMTLSFLEKAMANQKYYKSIISKR
jgi:hypothetical protein